MSQHSKDCVPTSGELPPLPAFIRNRDEGVFVDTATMTVEDDFVLFVDRLFMAGYRFLNLRYALFQQLVHEWTPNPGGAPERLADAIVPFEPARREAYKGVRVTPGGEKAEYFFEPAFIETIERNPVLKEDGTVLSWTERQVMLPTELDPDEFVFCLWGKGVRYGIDLEQVRNIIASKQTGRVEIAHMLASEEGSDASILEVFEALHRDDTPKRLAGGRLELRQYTNRFPHIGKDVAIFKKIPCVLGKPGFTVAGKVVEPAVKLKDFDLLSLSGPGTRVEKRPDGDYIVSSIDGFLSLDGQTNQVSVTEKVINIEGVSLRTTGDLNLAGDDFESHGDVQERRIVEGKNMAFHGEVYGQIISHGGKIKIGGNIVKGKAINPGGSIIVDGRASQAELRAVGGEIEVASAEGCVIIASKVRIEHAYSCVILTEELKATALAGCTVAATTIHIKTSSNRRDVETAVSVLIPDFGEYHEREQIISNEFDKLLQIQATLSGQIKQLREQPELKNFIALDMKITKGEIKLTAEQTDLAHRLTQRFRPIIQKIRELSVELDKVKGKSEKMQAELQEVIRKRNETAANIGCHIDQITGETVVYALPLLPLEPIGAQIAAIQPRLRLGKRLYSGNGGGFDWNYVKIEAQP